MKMKAVKLLGAAFLLVGLVVGHPWPAAASHNIPDPTHSTASGTGVTGGAFALHEVDILIQSRDDQGNANNIGGADFEVTLAGPLLGLPVPLHVTDNNNGTGTYSAHYIPLLPGTYTVAITLGGTNISGSPFHPVFTLP